MTTEPTTTVVVAPSLYLSQSVYSDLWYRAYTDAMDKGFSHDAAVVVADTRLMTHTLNRRR